MKKTVKAGVIVGAAVGAILIFGLPAKHVGPDYLYPNPKFTTGVAETLSLMDITAYYNGKTYSQAHRNVPASEAAEVYREYGIASHKVGDYEVDHFYPLCAGASNDIKNLWPQPAVNMWNGQDFGFHAKDRLEAYICREIKAGRLDPQVAFKKLTGDWVAYYEEIQGSKLGAVDENDN